MTAVVLPAKLLAFYGELGKSCHELFLVFDPDTAAGFAVVLVGDVVHVQKLEKLGKGIVPDFGGRNLDVVECLRDGCAILNFDGYLDLMNEGDRDTGEHRQANHVLAGFAVDGEIDACAGFQRDVVDLARRMRNEGRRHAVLVKGFGLILERGVEFLFFDFPEGFIGGLRDHQFQNVHVLSFVMGMMQAYRASNMDIYNSISQVMDKHQQPGRISSLLLSPP